MNPIWILSSQIPNKISGVEVSPKEMDIPIYTFEYRLGARRPSNRITLSTFHLVVFYKGKVIYLSVPIVIYVGTEKVLDLKDLVFQRAKNPSADQIFI